jgi:hypothetical protein
MVDVTPITGLFNQKCFYNAVEYARVNEGHSVVEVMMIDGSTPILHYLNKVDATEELLETTLGYRASKLEYYVIREIHKNDYDSIGDEFDRAVDSWLMEFTTWFDRSVLQIRRVV